MGAPDQISVATWLAAFARATTFAATVPLVGSGAVPRIVRAAFALTLTPAIAVRLTHDGSVSHGLAWIGNAALGAAYGLTASMLAAAASAAGSLIDGSLSMRPFGRDAVLAGDGGPFERVLSLGFGLALLATGGMTQMCCRFVAASSSAVLEFTAGDLARLAMSCATSGLDIAAPAIAAQALGTLIAAAAARAAPRVNGLMLASPLVTALVLMAMLACSAPILHALIDLARHVTAVDAP